MPAEGAARLLALSLLEQLSLAEMTPPGGNARGAIGRDDAYRNTLNRLRACITLYGPALGASVSRKARVRLRSAAKAANTLHSLDVQLGWLSLRTQSALDSVESDNGAAPGLAIDAAVRPSDRTLAVRWLRDRLARRHESATLVLQEAKANARPLRRLAKKLSVYTTAIRLDDMELSSSFGALTGRQLLGAIDTLRPALTRIDGMSGRRTLRRIRRDADHVVYLLEPVRASDAAHVAESARSLRDALERLEGYAIVADALVDGARRIGAVHMSAQVRTVVWPRVPDERPGNSGAFAPEPSHLADEIGRGLVSLGESLHDELAPAFDDFAAQWLKPDADRIFDDITHLAVVLTES